MLTVKKWLAIYECIYIHICMPSQLFAAVCVIIIIATTATIHGGWSQITISIEFMLMNAWHRHACMA